MSPFVKASIFYAFAFAGSLAIALFATPLIGGWSHVLLDSLMHSDMEPLAPFSAGSGMTNLVTIAQLELFCALAGALGVAVLLVMALRRCQQ